MLKRFVSILFAITVSSSFAEPIYKGFVINGNTVYTFIRIDGKLVAWELVEGYGKIAGNIAIVSTNSSDSFSIS